MSDLNKGNMSVGIGSICFAISAESDLSLAKEAVLVVFAATGASEGKSLIIWSEV
jgi:hypothetical protein